MQHTLVVMTAVTMAFVARPLLASDEHNSRADVEALSRVTHRIHRAACSAGADPLRAHCFAHVVTDTDGAVATSSDPQGYGPSDLQSAYKLPSTGGKGKTVAVIDAFDVPNAESDLAKYRSTFGLPECTTANGCFRKVNQSGGSDMPSVESTWASETTLDIDMVSAACPDCNILLVEADSDYIGDLWLALQTSVSLGAVAASNSYGFPEVSAVTWVEPYFNFPGVLVTASSGDSGYAVQYPASSAHVLTVGGTTLTRSTSARGWADAAWSSGGSGCSAFVSKPSWQTDTGCAKRMEVDVAAVADPNTGVSVYCSDCGSAHEGWQIMGGTSAGAPFVAAAFTALEVAASPSFPSTHSADFFDVVQGDNGSCGVAKFCNAGVGYDGPTGWGVLNGSLLRQGSTNAPSAPAADAGGNAAVDAGARMVADAGRDPSGDASSGGQSSQRASDDSGADSSDHESDAGRSAFIVMVDPPPASDGGATAEATTPSEDSSAIGCSMSGTHRQRPASEMVFGWFAALVALRRRRLVSRL